MNGGRIVLRHPGAYQGAGLKIWISWEVHNHVTMKPTLAGESTIAMARLIYGLKDPADRQMLLL